MTFIFLPLFCIQHDSITQLLNGALAVRRPLTRANTFDFAYDVISMILFQNDPELLQVGDAVLWFAGKQMIVEERLSKYVGTNEKVKLKVKLTRVASLISILRHGIRVRVDWIRLSFVSCRLEPVHLLESLPLTKRPRRR